ncbi:MAG: hypothetical protein H8E16_04340 [Flavobacteriales bacterium]|nr:hypothetical protein [Flavobacteriales bacterium]|tara:strand:+ start:5208 stop:5402 length:195 start_codon:yes stop_codon:yes gene_type:complete
MEGYNKERKEYNSFAMQFGWNMSSITENSVAKQYEDKKVYKYIDKRTKKYGAQRSHSGVMGKYK